MYVLRRDNSAALEMLAPIILRYHRGTNESVHFNANVTQQDHYFYMATNEVTPAAGVKMNIHLGPNFFSTNSPSCVFGCSQVRTAPWPT